MSHAMCMCNDRHSGMHVYRNHAVNFTVFGLCAGLCITAKNEVNIVAQYLPQDCAKTESACHDTPQQAAASDHPNPVEVVPCMANDTQ